MIFLTVGTLFPFDRLVMAVDKAVAEGLLEEDLIAQVGRGGARRRNIKCVEVLEKDEFDKYVNNASCLVSHAGMGSIIVALSHNKPLLVMPRRKKYGEAVNDHQVAIAKRLEELGHVLAAYNEKDLPNKIKELKTFIPKPRKAEPEKVAAKIAEYLDSIGG